MALADAHGTGLHAHFATSGEEDAWCLEHHGTTALRRMAELGLLERRLLLAHGCTVLPEDLPLLAGTDVALVLAPNVCMASGAAPPPARRALEHGVTVALGTDNVCNNGSYDMFAEMRAMGRLASFVSRVPDALPARTLLEMATVAGHRALGTGGGRAPWPRAHRPTSSRSRPQPCTAGRSACSPWSPRWSTAAAATRWWTRWSTAAG